MLKQVGEHAGPSLSHLVVGQTVAVAVSSDSTLRLCVDDVDYGIVAQAHDVCLTHCHAIVDVYGRCDRLCVVDDCGAPASPAVSEYQEKAAKENGNCTTMSRYTDIVQVLIFLLKERRVFEFCTGHLLYCMHTHTRLTALFPGLSEWAGTRKVKPVWILLARDSEWQWHQLGHMQSAPRFRQITTPAPHHSVFTGRMPFLPPSQQHQSTEGNLMYCISKQIYVSVFQCVSLSFLVCGLLILSRWSWGGFAWCNSVIVWQVMNC